MAQRQSK